MKWNEFKNRLQKEARQEEMEVDASEIWNGIVDQIEEEKPRRRKLLFWLSLVGLILMGTGFFFLRQTNIEEAPLAAQSSLINELKSSEQNPDAAAAINKTKAHSLENTPSNFANKKEIKNQTTEQENIFSNKKTTATTTKKPTLKTPSLTKNEEPLAERNFTLPPNPITDVITERSTGGEGQQYFKQRHRKSEGEDMLNFATPQNASPSIHNNSTDETLVAPTIKPLNTHSIGVSKTAASLERAVSIASFPLLASLPLSTLEASNFSLNLEAKYFPFSSLEEAQEEIRKTQQKRIQFYLGIQGGLSFINRTLVAKDQEADQLLSIREEYEKTLEARHFALLLHLEHTKGWRLSSGLQITSIAERYQNQSQQITNDSILGTKILRVNLEGDTIPIQGMLPQIITTSYNKKIFNTYRLFDIPLIIGYQRSFDQWQVGLEAGIFANLALKTRGIIPDKNLEDIDIKTQQNSTFKNTVGLSYHLGMTISRRLADRIEIRCSPSARFFPKDFAHKDYQLSQKYWLIGGNIGLHYRF